MTYKGESDQFVSFDLQGDSVLVILPKYYYSVSITSNYQITQLIDFKVQ